MSGKTEKAQNTVTMQDWENFYSKAKAKREADDVCIGVQSRDGKTDVYWTEEETPNSCRLKGNHIPKLGYMARKDVREFMEKFPKAGTQAPAGEAENPTKKKDSLGSLRPKLKEMESSKTLGRVHREEPASQGKGARTPDWFFEQIREIEGLKLPIHASFEEVEFVEVPKEYLKAAPFGASTLGKDTGHDHHASEFRETLSRNTK